jgi:hypothetical protein
VNSPGFALQRGTDVTEQQQQPAAPRSKLPWIIGGCCGCALLVIIGIVALGGLTAFGVMKATEPAATVSREFLAKAGSGDVAGAHDLFHPELKKALPLEELKAMVEQHPDVFKVTDSTFSSRVMEGGMVKLKGTIVTSKGETKNCLFHLVPDNGKWLLIKFQLDYAE